MHSPENRCSRQRSCFRWKLAAMPPLRWKRKLRQLKHLSPRRLRLLPSRSPNWPQSRHMKLQSPRPVSSLQPHALPPLPLSIPHPPLSLPPPPLPPHLHILISSFLLIVFSSFFFFFF